MSLLEPPQEMLTLLRDSLPDSVTATDSDDTSGSEVILAYVAFLAAGLCEVQDFAPATWMEVLQPYMEGMITGDDTTTADCVEVFRNAAEQAIMGLDDADSYGDEEDDEFEEVCNIRFK
jgi:hypothetical protein